MELGVSAFEVENAKNGRHWAGLQSVLGSEEWSALGWASIGTGQRGVVGAKLRSNELSREAGLIKMEDWKRKKEEERREAGEREKKKKEKIFF